MIVLTAAGWRPRALYVSLGGALALLVLAGCAKQEASPQAPRPAVVMTVKARPGSAWAVYSGEVHARHEVDQSFRIAGKIIERQVNLGDRVRRGQVLARLDGQDVTLSAAASRAQVAAAEADLALAQADYERARSLFGQKFISASALDAKRASHDAAQARLSQAKAQANVSGNQVGYASLLADRDGVITALPVEAGQVVAAGQAVARLADASEQEVLIWIPEARAARVKPGDSAFVRPWNDQDKTLLAHVREVAGSADSATRTYAVRVRLDAPDAALTLGSTAAVAFAAEPDQAAVVVPLPAVLRNAQGAQVWVVNSNNVVQARHVELGEHRDEEAVVRTGLAQGDRVVTIGAHALSAGMVVRPVDQQAPVALDVQR